MLCIVYLLLSSDPIVGEVTIEAGSELNIEQFYAKEDADLEASFQTTLSEENLKTPGVYEVIVECKNKEFTVTVTVKDTIAPTATLQEVEIYVDDAIDTDMFVVEYSDVTAIDIAFKNDISTNEAGKQEVILVLTDTSGNSSEYSTNLNVIEDTEAPVFSGLSDKSINVGDTIKYKSGVSVSDNHDDNVEFTVDSSAVNTNKAGTYAMSLSLFLRNYMLMTLRV